MIGRKPKLRPKQQAEVRVLIEEARRTSNGLTYATLGERYGVSASTIARTVGSSHKIGAPTLRRGPCAICGITFGKGRKIIRFSLSLHPPGSRSSFGAGSLDLCQRCWEAKAKRQRPNRTQRSTLVLPPVNDWSHGAGA